MTEKLILATLLTLAVALLWVAVWWPADPLPLPEVPRGLFIREVFSTTGDPVFVRFSTSTDTGLFQVDGTTMFVFQGRIAKKVVVGGFTKFYDEKGQLQHVYETVDGKSQSAPMAMRSGSPDSPILGWKGQMGEWHWEGAFRVTDIPSAPDAPQIRLKGGVK